MRSLPAICSTLAVALLAGCADAPVTPPPPLMSPYPASGHGYGYAEERLGPDLVRVVYHGPLRPVDYGGAPRQAELDRAAAEAADFALWRAAQLALAEGKPAFAVIERRTDTETLRQPGYLYDPWPEHCFPHRRYWRCQHWPPSYTPPVADARARATLTVRFEARTTPRNIDAAATVRRFEAATRPPVPPTSPPPSGPRG